MRLPTGSLVWLSFGFACRRPACRGVAPEGTAQLVRDANEKHGIVTQAWSPIGGITFYRDSGHASALEDPTITRLAEKYRRTPVQVMLRWGVQQGRSVIPKSTKPTRFAENFAVFDSP
jgi:diketogulonate reductase-like aldo/keto reductase